MKRIIKLSIGGFLTFTTLLAHSEGFVKFYATQGADAALVKVDDLYTLTLSGGAPPAGASTSADCYVKSREVKLKGDYLDGGFAPIHNGIANIDEKSVVGHRVFARLKNTTLEIKDADVAGICANDIDFTGDYKIVAERADLKRRYAYYLDMVHQEALLFLKRDRPKDAAKILAPYARAYQKNWLSDPVVRDILISSLNDYAYALQLNHRDDEAIPVFLTVLSVAPNRAVAWLNIADSYWSRGDFEKGRAAYKKYVELMNGSGGASKIPLRAQERHVNQYYSYRRFH
ncbi:tetratricopeptide repeat protein [Burkholderia seminalis]|uniref:tetratricopeptide repeat protein n=1 Tax=Burkholderia seminalis TaxID=488731 RepID=UPI00158C2CDC|nr:tetratricopeptide repeat protein [Burkholderia seminalis]